MAVNEKLTRRVREILAAVPKVAEKRMFRGITFMVDGKMCVSVGDDRIMCRIDPARHDEALAREGCRTVIMGGRSYRGFVYVDEGSLATKTALKAWVDLALDFNARARATKRPKAQARGAGGKTAKPARAKSRGKAAGDTPRKPAAGRKPPARRRP